MVWLRFSEPSWVPGGPVDPFLTFLVTREEADGAKATARDVCILEGSAEAQSYAVAQSHSCLCDLQLRLVQQVGSSAGNLSNPALDFFSKEEVLPYWSEILFSRHQLLRQALFPNHVNIIQMKREI